MSKEQWFYFLLLGHDPPGPGGDRRLQGFDFHGGLSSVTPKLHGKVIYAVRQEGVERVHANLGYIHTIHRGYGIHWNGPPVPNPPCLLTTDPSIRNVYSLVVRVTSNDEQVELVEFLERGWPICGEDWVGLLTGPPERAQLLAFAPDDVHFQGELKAYSPDLSDEMDDPDGVALTLRIVNSD